MRQKHSSAPCGGWKLLTAEFGDRLTELCHMLAKLDMKNHISFQLPRTLKRKKKELELYKYKKHLSAQEILLCYFANDPYLYLHEKSDLMNYIGGDAPFCSGLKLRVRNCEPPAGLGPGRGCPARPGARVCPRGRRGDVWTACCPLAHPVGRRARLRYQALDVHRGPGP